MKESSMMKRVVAVLIFAMYAAPVVAEEMVDLATEDSWFVSNGQWMKVRATQVANGRCQVVAEVLGPDAISIDLGFELAAPGGLGEIGFFPQSLSKLVVLCETTMDGAKAKALLSEGVASGNPPWLMYDEH